MNVAIAPRRSAECGDHDSRVGVDANVRFGLRKRTFAASYGDFPDLRVAPWAAFIDRCLEALMCENEAALSVLNRVIEAMNIGDNTEVLANMAENIVIVDDVAPFYRNGHADAKEWLQGIAKSRNFLQASFGLQSPEVNEADGRAYIVAPGLWKGRVPEEDLEVDGLATATLVQRGGRWLIDALIWGSMT